MGAWQSQFGWRKVPRPIPRTMQGCKQMCRENKLRCCEVIRAELLKKTPGQGGGGGIDRKTGFPQAYSYVVDGETRFVKDPLSEVKEISIALKQFESECDQLGDSEGKQAKMELRAAALIHNYSYWLTNVRRLAITEVIAVDTRKLLGPAFEPRKERILYHVFSSIDYLSLGRINVELFRVWISEKGRNGAVSASIFVDHLFTMNPCQESGCLFVEEFVPMIERFCMLRMNELSDLAFHMLQEATGDEGTKTLDVSKLSEDGKHMPKFSPGDGDTDDGMQLNHRMVVILKQWYQDHCEKTNKLVSSTAHPITRTDFQRACRLTPMIIYPMTWLQKFLRKVTFGDAFWVKRRDALNIDTSLGRGNDFENVVQAQKKGKLAPNRNASRISPDMQAFRKDNVEEQQIFAQNAQQRQEKRVAQREQKMKANHDRIQQIKKKLEHIDAVMEDSFFASSFRRKSSRFSRLFSKSGVFSSARGSAFKQDPN